MNVTGLRVDAGTVGYWLEDIELGVSREQPDWDRVRVILEHLAWIGSRLERRANQLLAELPARIRRSEVSDGARTCLG